MTEVPEHLLRRSRERRGAVGGAAEGGDEAGSQAVVAAAAATPAPAGGSGGGNVPAVPAPPPEPAYTGPPQRPAGRQRIPAWAMPVIVALPLWAVLYSGAFGDRATADTGPVRQGATVYRSAGCSGCHGVGGGGGVGPPMAGVLQTFPAFADHVAWVENGSAALKGQTYGATAKPATGQMPGFKESLTHEQIVAVVCHERVTYGKADPLPPECDPNAAVEAGGGEKAGNESSVPITRTGP